MLDPRKKERILEAAGRAFAHLGFRKASIDQIARAAGVAKGTVYLACENKEELFYQTLHRDLRAWLANVAKQIDPRIPADELLTQVAVSSLVYLDSHPLVRDLIAGLHDGTLPAWTERFEELRALSHANVVEILELGVRQGQFREDLDCEETARILQDLQLGGYMVSRRTEGIDPMERARRMRVALDLILNGLRARKKRKPKKKS